MHFDVIAMRRHLEKINLNFSHVFLANLSYLSNTLYRKFPIFKYIKQIGGLKQSKTLTQTI